MKKEIANKSKGYTLVEMIIVLAIIALLAGLALLSVTIITSARAKDSALKLDAAVSELIQKDKNMVPDPTKDSKYGIVIYKEDNSSDEDYGKFKIAKVVTIKTTSSSGWYKYAKRYEDPVGSDIYKYDYINSIDDVYFVDNPIVIPRDVEIEFEGTSCSFKNGATDVKSAGFNPGIMDGTGAVCILFDKKGNCISGYGTYQFKKNNGNVVSRVTIRKNGSHEVK